MTKSELLTRTKEIAATNEVSISKKDLDVVMNAFETAIMEDVKDGGKTKAFGVTYSSKVVPAREGIIQLGDSAGSKWTKPEHTEGCVKASKALKELFAE